jgi:hypothetical protein
MPEQLVIGIDYPGCLFFIYHMGILPLRGGTVKMNIIYLMGNRAHRRKTPRLQQICGTKMPFHRLLNCKGAFTVQDSGFSKTSLSCSPSD